jgi:hypothetical protein
MGLKITPKFTNSDIESIINDRKERILAAAISRLQVVGEKFVTNARNNGAYKDRTGNLRSSAGYVIIKDGKQLFENFQAFPQKDPKAEGAGQGVSQAQKTAAEVAEKIIGKYPTGSDPDRGGWNGLRSGCGEQRFRCHHVQRHAGEDRSGDRPGRTEKQNRTDSMKTTLELVNIIWQVLTVSPVKEEITGGIFKHIRPLNSEKEDVVINSLPNLNTDLSQAVVNVNVFVPNKTQNLNGAQDNSQPDAARLEELAGMATDALKDQWGDDYNFDVQQSVLIRDEEGGSWYYNIRLNFYSINV